MTSKLSYEEALALIQEQKVRIEGLEEQQILALRTAERDAEIIATQNNELTEAAKRIAQQETEIARLSALILLSYEAETLKEHGIT